MHPDDQRKINLGLILFLPIVFWITAVQKTEQLGKNKFSELWELVKITHTKPVLLASATGGLALAILLVWLISTTTNKEFAGAPFRRFLRGTKTVSPSQLRRKTRDKKKEQVDIASIPMPISVETFHTLLNGATGSGKSVVLRALAFSVLKRKDRMIFIDPNGDMLSKFYRKGDKILNPYDARTEGWSIFNEIRKDYDFQRYSYSLVPLGETKEAEEWASYGRLLLRETAKKLATIGSPSIRELFHWTTIASFDDLRAFLEGTLAESLFAGSNEASKALTSARFVLSDKLPEHVTMPAGNFSIRDWLESEKGNLFITWREDMAPALRPLISAFTDVICTSVLSMEPDNNRRIWLQIDELASLEKLASLEDALTKGRKHGLRVVAGLQSTSQLDDKYGQQMAQTIRANFRNLVVLGGSRPDPKTSEDMSLSLGEHEVERDKYSKSSGKSTSTNKQLERNRERVVMPAEIANLPELTAYVAFAGDHPITKVKLEYVDFVERVPAFVEEA